MKKLNLETSYKVNGNSTGAPIDTLAIAVYGNDSNSLETYEGEGETQRYVLDNYDYEADMLKAATKAQLKAWLKDPLAQAAALDEYTDEHKEALLNGEDTESDLYKEVEKALDSYRDDQYKEFIYGDHRNWAGILSLAEREYGLDDIEFKTEKGEVYAEISEELIKEWKENGSIDRKTQAYGHLTNLINNDAESAYYKRMQENKKRKEESERLQAYRKEQAEAAEVKRQDKIKKLIKTK